MLKDTLQVDPFVEMYGVPVTRLGELDNCLAQHSVEFIPLTFEYQGEQLAVTPLQDSGGNQFTLRSRVARIGEDEQGKLYALTQSWFDHSGRRLIKSMRFQYGVSYNGEIVVQKCDLIIPFVDRSEQKLLHKLLAVGGKSYALESIHANDVEHKCLVLLDDLILCLKGKGLDTLLIIGDSFDGGNDTLYVFDRQALSQIVEENKELLAENGWPTQVDEFVWFYHSWQFVLNSDVFELLVMSVGADSLFGKATGQNIK